MGVEQKLIVGRFLEFKLPNIRPPQNPQGNIVNQSVMNMSLLESTGTFQKQSTILQGVGSKVHRNFQWLAWMPGEISAVQLSWGDVLTGPMSGCWVVVFRQNGMVYVGHIGTSDPGSPQTNAVKTAWRAFTDANPQAPFPVGFNPFRAWQGPDPKQEPGDMAADIFGLVTVQPLEFYTVWTYKGNGTKRPVEIRRVAAIKKVEGTNAEADMIFT
jgi:hypothetical protein